MQLKHLFCLWRQPERLPEKPSHQVIASTAQQSLPKTEPTASLTEPRNDAIPQSSQTASGESESYFFLRIGKANRWEQSDEADTPPTAEQAVKDLTLRLNEKGLSLYRICNDQEVKELACIFSLTLRDNPTHFEYVLFPSSVLSDYRVGSKPVSEHHSFLSERHYEIPEPSTEQLLRLAQHILGSPAKRVGRMKRPHIVAFAIQTGLYRIGAKWRKLIESKMARPNTDNQTRNEK
jgi:hypothetical protein